MGRDTERGQVACGDWGPWSGWQPHGLFFSARSRARQCTETFRHRQCEIIVEGTGPTLTQHLPAEEVCAEWEEGEITYDEVEWEYSLSGLSRDLEQQINQLKDGIVTARRPLYYDGRMFLNASWVDKMKGISSHAVYLEGRRVDETQTVRLGELLLGENHLSLQVERRDGTKKKFFVIFRTINLIELTVDGHAKSSHRAKQRTSLISFTLRVKNNSPSTIPVFLEASKVPAGWGVHLHPQLVKLKPGGTGKVSLLATHKASKDRKEGGVGAITIVGRTYGPHLDAITVNAGI